MSAGWTHCSLLAVKSLWSPTPAAPTPLLVTTCYLARALPFFLTLRPSKLWQRPQKTLPEPLLNLLLNELRWGVVAAGDPSVSSDLFDPSLECFCTCWIPWSLPLSPRAPITSLESAASVFTGSPTPSSSCPLNALSTPGWPMVPQPCSVSAPPETMSPLLTALPLMCHSAGRPAASSHGPCSLNLLLEGQCSEAQREEEDSPAQQTAVLTCPLLPATPSLPRSGVEPSQQLPFIRPAATSCNQK